MKWFRRLSIRSKLLILVAVMSALTLAIAVTGLFSVLTISKGVEFSTLTITLPMEELNKANYAYGQMMLQTRDLSQIPVASDPDLDAVSGATADPNGNTDNWVLDSNATTYAEEYMKDYSEAINTYYNMIVGSGITSGREYETLEQIVVSSNVILPMIQECIDYAKQGETVKASQYMVYEIKPKTSALNQALQELTQINREKSESLLSDAYRIRNGSVLMIVFAIVIGVLIVAPVAVLIIIAIVLPIRAMSNEAVELMNGNFERADTGDNVSDMTAFEKTQITTKDEIEILKKNFEKMRLTIRNVKLDIQDLVENANDGKLDARADVSKYSGGWNLLMEQLNRLLDNIIIPITEASAVLSEIAGGNFEPRVVGDYNGEFAVLKETVNTTAVGFEAYINSVLRAELMALESEIAMSNSEAARKQILESINYASKIQRNSLPRNSLFEEAFTDYAIIWNPRDIVGGDIYWIKNFNAGTVLCVCDCTGHGTPGALLTMLVVSALQDIVNESNCNDTAEIMWRLDRRLVNILKADITEETLDIQDGCDLAIMFIAKDGDITLSSGHTHVFMCDGEEVTQFRGQNIFIGTGKLKDRDKIKITYLPYNPRNKFYIATDGLYDQVSEETDLPFGYKRFKKIILENHDKKQFEICDIIWNTFNEYRGEAERLDDFALITFKA